MGPCQAISCNLLYILKKKKTLYIFARHPALFNQKTWSSQHWRFLPSLSSVVFAFLRCKAMPLPILHVTSLNITCKTSRQMFKLHRVRFSALVQRFAVSTFCQQLNKILRWYGASNFIKAHSSYQSFIAAGCKKLRSLDLPVS